MDAWLTVSPYLFKPDESGKETSGCAYRPSFLQEVSCMVVGVLYLRVTSTSGELFAR